MRRLLCFALFLTGFGSWSIAQAVSASGIISMRVVRTLFVEAKEPLNFQNASPGAEDSSVEPGDPNSAQFVVRGEPNTAFQIHLPEETVMIAEQGLQDNQKIRVHSFTSYPAQHGNLSATGEQILYVGATRSALRADQAEGSYSGLYSIDIIY